VPVRGIPLQVANYCLVPTDCIWALTIFQIKFNSGKNIHFMVMNSPNCSTCLFSWYRLLIWSVVSVVSVVTSVRPHCTALTVKIWSIKVTKPNELELNKSYYRQQLLQILNVAVSLIYYVSLTRDCIKCCTRVRAVLAGAFEWSMIVTSGPPFLSGRCRWASVTNLAGLKWPWV